MNHGLPETKNGPEMADVNDPAVQTALRNFRGSVNAWSDAAYHRPRTVAIARPGIAWRRVTGSVLALAISAGLVGTAGYERHQANVAAMKQKQFQQQRLLAEQHAREAEDLMANIDSDVAREVPSAMEPLAQLMGDNNGQ
jgi:hypothetical protein